MVEQEFFDDLQVRHQHLKECYDIVLKTARRVARDLGHSIDQIQHDNEFRQMMLDRLADWLVILDDVREYRMALHTELGHKEREVSSLQDRVKSLSKIGAVLLNACKICVDRLKHHDVMATDPQMNASCVSTAEQVINTCKPLLNIIDLDEIGQENELNQF